jgi:hypothetical protein
MVILEWRVGMVMPQLKVAAPRALPVRFLDAKAVNI